MAHTLTGQVIQLLVEDENIDEAIRRSLRRAVKLSDSAEQNTILYRIRLRVQSLLAKPSGLPVNNSGEPVPELSDVVEFRKLESAISALIRARPEYAAMTKNIK